MDAEARAMKMLKFGLLINRIAMLLDDRNLKKVKPTLEELEKELITLFEQLEEVQ